MRTNLITLMFYHGAPCPNWTGDKCLQGTRFAVKLREHCCTGFLDDLVGFLGGTRTHNRLLRRQMLYPVKLRGNNGAGTVGWTQDLPLPWACITAILCQHWWGQRDLNPYDISHRSLSSARLPIPSCPHFGDSGRSRTDDQGVAVLRLTTWLRNHFGRDSWGRTSASGSQSPLPYHLATSLFFWWAEQDSNLRTQWGLIYSQLRLTTSLSTQFYHFNMPV